ncbi:MAG: hypothetical protein GXO07_03295 [Crenarchaeota archaeon]|nr:hypothetical protein [Thermoproteota archaeon]
MRVCAFTKDGSAPPGCPKEGLRLYTLEAVEVAEGVEIRRLRKGDFWNLVFQIFMDEPCDVVCIDGGHSVALVLASLLRRDKACAKVENVKFSLVGAWSVLQLDEPLRTIALYVLSKGEIGVSPKELVHELWERIGLERESPSSYKLAWNYLKELEKKGIVRRVLRGRYTAREELLRC